MSVLSKGGSVLNLYPFKTWFMLEDIIGKKDGTMRWPAPGPTCVANDYCLHMEEVLDSERPGSFGDQDSRSTPFVLYTVVCELFSLLPYDKGPVGGIGTEARYSW